MASHDFPTPNSISLRYQRTLLLFVRNYWSLNGNGYPWENDNFVIALFPRISVNSPTPPTQSWNDNSWSKNHPLSSSVCLFAIPISIAPNSQSLITGMFLFVQQLLLFEPCSFRNSKTTSNIQGKARSIFYLFGWHSPMQTPGRKSCATKRLRLQCEIVWLIGGSKWISTPKSMEANIEPFLVEKTYKTHDWMWWWRAKDDNDNDETTLRVWMDMCVKHDSWRPNWCMFAICGMGGSRRVIVIRLRLTTTPPQTLLILQ